nr:U-box domain-containing protein 44-like [Ipomoea batatas]
MSTLVVAVEESLQGLLSEIAEAGDDEHQYAWENARRFSGYVKRLQLVLGQLLRTLRPEADVSAAVQTSLKGIAGDLRQGAEALAVYRRKSKIFVLINCQSLRASLQERTLAIGGWLALLDSALAAIPDLQKKIADLSREMKQAQFKVTENEERVCRTLQKEGQRKQTCKAVQSAIVMDLARALGIDLSNYSELIEEVKQLKNDLGSSNSISERRILMSLEKIVDNWSLHLDILTLNLDLDFEDEAHISPFKNFLCPLTKEVMRDPVVLESAQTYERTAIQYWFERCLEDGRDPTCPVTGLVLKSLELKPNIGLAGAIEEWVNRNVDIQIKSAVQCLSEDPPAVNLVERALDSMYKISEEHPSSRCRIRDAGIVPLVVKLLKNSSKSIGSLLRSKGFMALLSMCKDDECKKIMLEEGTSRLAIHGLIGNSDKEKEYATRLLLEFCNDEAYCRRAASEKGALVLLSGMADDLENPSLSHLAENVLNRMENVEDNIKHLAAAGRFDPLIKRLCEGPDDVKVEMASLVGEMTLANRSKEQIARQGAKTLVELLAKPEGRIASLKALYNLSSLDDNATLLVDSGVLPSLTEILLENQVVLPELKELGASILANLVSTPGHWELASLLQILCGIVSSPQASESTTAHIKAGDGIKVIIKFLEHHDVECRIYAFRLARVLSERLSVDFTNEFRPSNKLPMLREKIIDNQSTDGERSDAACILANLALSENEVRTILEDSFVGWTVAKLKDQQQRLQSSMEEGLLGLLLHYTRSAGPQSISVIKENRLMTIFRDQLIVNPRPRLKQLASIGLKNLSEIGQELAGKGDLEPRHPKGLCSPLALICGGSKSPSSCPIHNAPCGDDSQFCLLRSNCVKPLVDTITDKDTSVQIAALEALSTLLLDTSSGSKRAIEELERLGVVSSVVSLFTEARPGELQERTIWMVERILRVESFTQQHSLNQSLVKALVDAFKHGNAITKRHAQDALTNLKQISGVSGKASSQNRGRR